MSDGDNAAAGRPMRAPWERWQMPPGGEPDVVHDYPDYPETPETPELPESPEATTEIPTGSHATGELTVADLIARLGGTETAPRPGAGAAAAQPRCR